MSRARTFLSGPVQTAVAEQIEAITGTQARVTIVAKSPFGGAAVLAQPIGKAAPKLAEQVETAPWVDATAVSKNIVFLRPKNAACAEWVRGRAVQFAAALATLAIPEIDLSLPLNPLRNVLVSRALSVLSKIAPHSRQSAPPPCGPVDLARGRLRARYGGEVTGGDLVDHIARLAKDRGLADAICAEHGLCFLLLRVAPIRHVAIGGPRDGEEVALFSAVNQLAQRGLDGFDLFDDLQLWLGLDRVFRVFEQASYEQNPAIALRGLVQFCTGFSRRKNAVLKEPVTADRHRLDPLVIVARASLTLCGSPYIDGGISDDSRFLSRLFLDEQSDSRFA